MKLTYFPNHAARNSGPVLEAWVRGCVRQAMHISPGDATADVAVLWSQLWAGRMRGNQEIYHRFQTTDRPVVIIDAGFITRNHTWKISLAGDAYLAGHGHDAQRRQSLGITLRDWRQSGDSIVIALQRPDSNQWAGMPDPSLWLDQIIHSLRQHTDRAIVIRPHPRFPLRYPVKGVCIQQPRRVPDTYDDFDFEQAVAQAWCVVNWNSTPGSVAVCHGIPAFVGQSSLAAPVANLDLGCIERPSMPDREQWANDLAWTEWTLEEIASGVPQGLLRQRLTGQ